MSEKLKKIMVLNPMVEGGDFFRDMFASVKDVEVVSLSQGPLIIHGGMDYALAGFDSVRKAREAEAAGYGAIVLTCNGDPNLYPLREAVRIPVLGPTQVAMHFCSLLGRRFSIILPDELVGKRSKEDAATRYGFESKIASIRGIQYNRPLEKVGELSRRKPVPEEIIKPTVEGAIKSIKEDDATMITFGCAFLGLLENELREGLKARGFDIPIINPVPMAVEVARLLIKLNLTHSILAFPLAATYLVREIGEERIGLRTVG